MEIWVHLGHQIRHLILCSPLSSVEAKALYLKLSSINLTHSDHKSNISLVHWLDNVGGSGKEAVGIVLRWIIKVYISSRCMKVSYSEHTWDGSQQHPWLSHSCCVVPRRPEMGTADWVHDLAIICYKLDLDRLPSSPRNRGNGRVYIDLLMLPCNGVLRSRMGGAVYGWCHVFNPDNVVSNIYTALLNGTEVTARLRAALCVLFIFAVMGCGVMGHTTHHLATKGDDWEHFIATNRTQGCLTGCSQSGMQ